MIGNKKVIGVCVTKIHDTPRSRTIRYLHKEATKHGYKLMLFNTSFDVSTDIMDEIGVSKIYDFINFDIIDALIIFCGGFFDEESYMPIIDRALKANIPVILEDRIHEKCFTVRNSPEIAFEALVNHVIKDHGVKDTFFIAGIKGNAYSDERVELYKKVLLENGLPYSDDMVDYGGFWEGPTQPVMDRLFEREKLPRAIICANDAMAIAVCDRLIDKGLRVPEDVIVTGFDGSPGAELSKPKITTCVVDAAGFSEKCIQIVDAYFADENPPLYNDNPYRINKSESCGCDLDTSVDFQKMAKYYHHLFTDMNGHEYVIYNQIIYQLNSQGMDSSSFFGSMSRILGENAFLTLRQNILSFFKGNEKNEDADSDNEKMFIISSGYENDISESSEFLMKDLIPNQEEWMSNDSMYIISALQIGKTVLGFYEVATNNIIRDSQKINRVLNIINMMIHLAVSDVRHRYIRNNKNNDSTIDYLTELANREGITKWYDAFTNQTENKDKYLILSVYQIPKYRFIYDNYGIEEINEIVTSVAETIRIANPKDVFIAHTSEDEFVTINFYNKQSDGENDIKRATKVFYGLIDTFNKNNDKDYNVEIDFGCTKSYVNESPKLEGLIHLAIDELYENKKHYGKGSALKNHKISSREEYHLFNTLIEKNMFSYHFQPIVRADNGQIYAYEALMRTDSVIGFSPLEVLDIAKEYQRLYDIERATMFNVMCRYVDDKDKFKDRKIFINSLPGYFLNKQDKELFGNLYSEYVNNFVFEITEGDTTSPEELDRIRYLGNEDGTNVIAVDDYGTGHSNIVNLINYAPQIVKIDRFLMSDIHNDSNKQMLVKGVIDFAKANDIKVLAEGIETSDELKKVIELGVDYIQGYYTGRPVLEPIDEIDASIKEEICTAYSKR